MWCIYFCLEYTLEKIEKEAGLCVTFISEAPEGLKLKFLFERFAYTTLIRLTSAYIYSFHTTGLSQRNCGSSNALSNTIQSRLQDLAYKLEYQWHINTSYTRLKTLIGSLPISLARPGEAFWWKPRRV